jgi:hypothetical protein
MKIMKIKKNGKVITLTESDLKKIVKEQSKESLNMQGVDTNDVHGDRINDLESRVKKLESQLKLLIPKTRPN